MTAFVLFVGFSILNFLLLVIGEEVGKIRQALDVIADSQRLRPR